MERLPYALYRVECLVDIAGLDGDDCGGVDGLALAAEVGEDILRGVGVDDDKRARGADLGGQCVDGVADEVGEDQFLFHSCFSV